MFIINKICYNNLYNFAIFLIFKQIFCSFSNKILKNTEEYGSLKTNL